MVLKEIWCQGAECIHLAQGTGCCEHCDEPSITIKAESLFTNCTSTNFSRGLCSIVRYSDAYQIKLGDINKLRILGQCGLAYN
jgi:hypothetical protein